MYDGGGWLYRSNAGNVWDVFGKLLDCD
jgi:hypothetical protein